MTISTRRLRLPAAPASSLVATGNEWAVAAAASMRRDSIARARDQRVPHPPRAAPLLGVSRRFRDRSGPMLSGEALDGDVALGVVTQEARRGLSTVRARLRALSVALAALEEHLVAQRKNPAAPRSAAP